MRAINHSDPPFDNGITYTLSEYDFEGESAIGVYANGEMIGNVPATQVKRALNIMDRIISIDARIVGGGTVDGEKISYGARMTVTYRKKT